MSQATLTPPGHIFLKDFRPAGQNPTSKPSIKLLQWNIERGYELEGIIEELKRIDADVLSLQEVDVGCDRSGGIDTGLAVAAALQLNYIFLSEFEELRSPLRDARSQGGGVHGNALLTKFDVVDVAVVPHRTHPVDWNNPAHTLAQREPRRGERAVLRAAVATPQGPLVVYNAHLEVFCGLLARIAQLSDIFADARRQADAGRPHQAILGDMNTMAHGIARLSPHYCCDRMRFRTVGLDEAAVWHRHVLPVWDPRYIDASHGSSSSSSSGRGPSAAAPAEGPAAESAGYLQQPGAEPSAAAGGAGGGAGTAGGRDAALAENRQLLAWGLSQQVAQDATNPGFSDPFDPHTVTLDNPRYRWFGLSLMKGKLDWVLLRRLRVVAQSVGNHGFQLSDHKWLAAEVALD